MTTEQTLIESFMVYVQYVLNIKDKEVLDWIENVLEDNTDFLEDGPTMDEIHEFILGELESLD